MKCVEAVPANQQLIVQPESSTLPLIVKPDSLNYYYFYNPLTKINEE